jgi:hypothetical protein
MILIGDVFDHWFTPRVYHIFTCGQFDPLNWPGPRGSFCMTKGKQTDALGPGTPGDRRRADEAECWEVGTLRLQECWRGIQPSAFKACTGT